MPTDKADARQNFSSGGAYEGVFGYSRAVRIRDQIHVSGTCAPPSHEGTGAYEQAKAALEIIGRVLVDAGGRFDDVVRTVVYLRDINDADAVARAHLEVFDKIRPASTLIQIDGMIRTWQRVEIEAYAIV